jgi:serine/threonine protein kinase
MATVYKAFDTHVERDVALKFIRSEKMKVDGGEKMIKRFKREAQALAKLSHPNILTVLDYGDYEGQLYLVTEYMPGGTLKEKLGKPLPSAETAKLLVPIARALEFAHSQNILHRDIKPANILLSKSGLPVLSDFGIAKLLEGEETSELTNAGVGVGTPEYMSPEQAEGKADRRSDVYALGVVFYELVTGRKPYKADTPFAVLLKHVKDPLPPPKQYVANLPRQTEQVLFKALAKKPADRYQTMAEFAQALERLTQLSDTTPALNIKQGWAVGAVATVVIIASIAGGLWWAQSQRSDSTPTAAVVQVLPTSTGVPTRAAQPTTTNIPALTLTPTPTMLPTPLPYGKLIFQDDFKTSTSGLDNYRKTDSGFFYNQGHYQIFFKPDVHAKTVYSMSANNFILEVDVTPQASTDGYFGVVFRLQGDDEFCQFQINTSQRYQANCWGGTINTTREGGKPAIKSGTATNRLTVIADGSTLSFYVNGEFLDITSYNKYLSGKFGLRGYAGKTDLNVQFDRLRLYSLAP